MNNKINDCSVCDYTETRGSKTPSIKNYWAAISLGIVLFCAAYSYWEGLFARFFL
jgi:hypothetical protein